MRFVVRAACWVSAFGAGKTALRGAVIALALVFPAAPAWALWREMQLTPGNLDLPERTFTIQVEPREKLLRYTVKVMPKDRRPISPYASGSLRLILGDETVGVTPVQRTWDNGAISFQFEVARTALIGSRFDFQEGNWGGAGKRGEAEARRDEKNREIRLPGGRSWWFSLRDFSGEAAKE